MFYDSEHINALARKDDHDELWSLCDQKENFMVGSEAFLSNNPASNITGLSDGKVNIEEKTKFTEFAPMIFRNIRKKYITEKTFYDSFIPTLNPQGIFKFETG